MRHTTEVLSVAVGSLDLDYAGDERRVRRHSDWVSLCVTRKKSEIIRRLLPSVYQRLPLLSNNNPSGVPGTLNSTKRPRGETMPILPLPVAERRIPVGKSYDFIRGAVIATAQSNVWKLIIHVEVSDVGGRCKRQPTSAEREPKRSIAFRVERELG